MLHVGASKSGTTAFQASMAISMDRLAASGYEVPVAGREAFNNEVLYPLGWEAGSGFVNRPVNNPLARLRRALQQCDERSSVLLSNEDLAEVDADVADAVVRLGRDQGFDVHVVVTARDWGKQLPSEWQQFLKHRMTEDFDTFLHSVRERSGFYGLHFWRRQDFADICQRWGRLLPADHVHLVPVPSRGDDPHALFATMAEVLGVPPETLRAPARDVNRSYGVVEAEVYRRLNAELVRRHPHRRRRNFGPVRRVLSRGALRRGASKRLALPPEHYAWVRDVSDDIVRRLEKDGYAVHGDLTRLLPREDETRPIPAVREKDVATAAIRTLAAFADATVLASPPRPARPAPARHLARARRLLSGARHRLARRSRPRTSGQVS